MDIITFSLVLAVMTLYRHAATDMYKVAHTYSISPLTLLLHTCSGRLNASSGHVVAFYTSYGLIYSNPKGRA